MQEIKEKKKLLQNEINRLQTEMNTIKVQVVNEPFSSINSKTLTQKDIYEHVQEAENIEKVIEPVRLEFVKLKRHLEVVEEKYLTVTRNEQGGIDQRQIMIDNQVKKCGRKIVNRPWFMVTRLFRC